LHLGYSNLWASEPVGRKPLSAAERSALLIVLLTPRLAASQNAPARNSSTAAFYTHEHSPRLYYLPPFSHWSLKQPMKKVTQNV